MKRLLLIVLLAACGGYPLTSPLVVSVTSHSWDADAVRVHCDSGAQLGVLEDVVFNATRSRRLPLMGCRRVYLTIDTYGRHDAWTAPDYILVEPGDSLLVTIGPSLSLTTWRVRQ